jgi:hypothetical protein
MKIKGNLPVSPDTMISLGFGSGISGVLMGGLLQPSLPGLGYYIAFVIAFASALMIAGSLLRIAEAIDKKNGGT